MKLELSDSDLDTFCGALAILGVATLLLTITICVYKYNTSGTATTVFIPPEKPQLHVEVK